jgi:DsbC/DsbD-like thiol-disulfide interchange protein
MRRLVLIPILTFAIAAFAQEPVAEPAVVELKLASKTVAKGGTVKGSVVVTFAPGWHGYQNPTMREYEIPLKVSSPTKGIALKATYPKGKEIESAGAKTWAYEGTVVVPITLTVPKKAGTVSFKIDVAYQQCNDQTCLPPDMATLSGKITVK